MKAIFTYHSIDDSDSVISVDTDTFRRQVDWLCSEGVPIRSLSDVIESDCAEGVALTFDDGFENFATEAWPILNSYGVPATVFVASGRVGRENDWDADDPRIPRLPLMDWSTISDLATAGVEVGGHSHTHPDLRGLAGDPLRVELEACRDTILERCGVAPTAFAYPYGHYDRSTREAVEDAGYTVAVTTEMALLDDSPCSPFELPRLDAFYLKGSAVLERWGTQSFRRFVWLRGGARRLRRALTSAGLPL
jgi:peptidoglycan/xylan/chitin deacetylase (PgdA/CDA1 family)